MRLPRTAFLPLYALALIYLATVLSGFLAPYDPAIQDRYAVLRPPTRIHWVTQDGKFHWTPVVFGTAEPTEDPASEANVRKSYPVQLLPRGAPYKILGVLPCDRHLFGVALPGRLYLMGTDGYGRDVLSRLLYGGQISLFAGLLATAVALTLGTLLGTLAGFYGSWTDAIIMRAVELFLALPWLYLLLALRAFLPLRTGPTQTLLLLVAVIGLVGWARPARLIRGVVLSAKERTHILAARSFGATDSYLLRRHLLPETRSVALTQAALLIPQYILAEVTLSFLGLGMAEPVPSWGNMLAALQQYHVLVTGWWMFFPGFALVLVCLCFGLLSNALQKSPTRMGVG